MGREIEEKPESILKREENKKQNVRSAQHIYTTV